jgi:hypothetical protein
MKRVMVVLTMLAAWAGVASHSEALEQQDGRTAVSDGDHPPAAAVHQPPQPPPPSPPPPPPPPPENRPRRIGSMVGYIDDAIIESQVRVRFEVGWGNHAPDRAEFFYAKCGCYRDLAGTPAAQFFDPDSPGPGPGVVQDMNFQQFMVQAEYAANSRFSIFGEIPLRWIQPQAFVPDLGSFDDKGGFGDLRAGAKMALAASPDYTVTFRLQAYLPTGSASKGLGTDHASIEPTLLYFQKFPNTSDRFALEGQFGFWFPIGGSDGPDPAVDDGYAGNVLVYGIGPSYVVYDANGVRVAPVVELVGWSVLSGFEAPPGTPSTDAGGTNIVNLKFGARFNFQTRNSLYVGYGHSLTDESWYDDILRVEYRYAF